MPQFCAFLFPCQHIILFFYCQNAIQWESSRDFTQTNKLFKSWQSWQKRRWRWNKGSKSFGCNLPISGKTPNIVSTLESTHPEACCQLILVDGDILGQERLRILPVAAVLWLESASKGEWRLWGWHAASESEGLETTVCIQCIRAHSCSFRTVLCYSKAVVSSSQLSRQLMLFWGPCRRHRCLSERQSFWKSLRRITGIFEMLLLLYLCRFKGIESKVAITLKELWQVDFLKPEGIKRLVQ